MKALMYHGRRDIRMEDVPVPRPGAGQVLVRVTDAGLSQTQVNEFIEGPFIINTTPHARTGVGAPIIPCQEFGGIVHEAGPGVDAGWLGKQVTVLPLTSCGSCDACRAGNTNHCPTMAYAGLLGGHGGFAEFALADASRIVACPRRSWLTFVEPLLVGLHSFRLAGGDMRGKRALVIGAGAVGCAVAAVWKHRGADVTLFDLLPERLVRAGAAGLPGATEDRIAGQRFDFVVDAAGKDLHSPKCAFTEAMGYVRAGGVMVSLGTYFSPVSFVPVGNLVNETCLVHSFAYNEHDLPALATLLAELPNDFEPLVERIPLDRMIDDGYYRAAVGKADFTRIVATHD